MKPTVIANPNAASSNGNGSNNAAPGHAGAGIHIPINRETTNAGHGSPQQHPVQFQPYAEAGNTAYGSPRQQQNPMQQQHFQSPFGFESDMDMDNMFPRTRLGRLHQDPFAAFNGSRKRNSLHDPHHPSSSMHADDDFSFFNDAADFGVPQWASSTLGRRGRPAGGANSRMQGDDDFFNRLPSEFRPYIPDGFATRRSGGMPQAENVNPQQSHVYTHVPQQQPMSQSPHAVYQQQQQPMSQPPQAYYQQQQPMPQSPTKRLCDAAIQTEDTIGRSEVDCVPLNQHGLRNTMDMGIKTAAEQDQAARSHSAPPPEQQQQNFQYQQQQQQQQPRPKPAPAAQPQQQQFGTQTSPGPQQYQQQPPQYYMPQTQPHPQQKPQPYFMPQTQQKQQTPPPPQTPNGSNVRTIPIFVEGRSEPIINAHKEIPNQHAAAGTTTANAQAHAQMPQQPAQHTQQRPSPLNTQQQPQQEQMSEADAGLPPQTPHTLDSISKIQDIQRDVLDLMGKVEQYKGMRKDKEYVYLDEMLTRNLLKLDTIDTNGKDSIRLARKEAIKCIQASINVLEAKAEENARMAAGAAVAATSVEEAPATSVPEPMSPQPADATKIQEPIPLPPPPGVAAGTATEAGAEPAQATTTQEEVSCNNATESTTLTESSK